MSYCKPFIANTPLEIIIANNLSQTINGTKSIENYLIQTIHCKQAIANNLLKNMFLPYSTSRDYACGGLS